MPGLAPLAFLNPWLLVALIGLPALWFLLRVTPPAPRSQRFPAIRLLLGLEPPEQTPARTPWWLLLLRLLAAALLILGLAGPVLHPAGQLGGSGPLVLAIDDGWAAGKDWDARVQQAQALIDRAERENRRVRILTTAQARSDAPQTASDLIRPDAARELIRAIQPKPWPVDYAAAAEVANGLQVTGSAHVVWLSDGLAADGARALAVQLQRLGRLEVLRPQTGRTALTVLPPESTGTTVEVPLRRADGAGQPRYTAVAYDTRGRLVGTAEARFEEGSTQTTARFELPLELRNRIAQVAVEGESHAGAVALLDSRWQRRPVGMVSATPLADAQPLLSELYYLDRALKPYAEVSRGSLDELLQADVAVIALPDRGALPSNQRRRVADWIEAGGVILRFAGPRLADDLTLDGTGGSDADGRDAHSDAATETAAAVTMLETASSTRFVRSTSTPSATKVTRRGIVTVSLPVTSAFTSKAAKSLAGTSPTKNEDSLVAGPAFSPWATATVTLFALVEPPLLALPRISMPVAVSVKPMSVRVMFAGFCTGWSDRGRLRARTRRSPSGAV